MIEQVRRHGRKQAGGGEDVTQVLSAVVGVAFSHAHVLCQDCKAQVHEFLPGPLPSQRCVHVPLGGSGPCAEAGAFGPIVLVSGDRHPCCSATVEMALQ